MPDDCGCGCVVWVWRGGVGVGRCCNPHFLFLLGNLMPQLLFQRVLVVLTVTEHNRRHGLRTNRLLRCVLLHAL